MADAATPDDGELEDAARKLERSSDYRVIRRLRERDRFAEPAGPTARAIIVDTETTGLDLATDALVELALVSFTYDIETARVVSVAGVYDGLEDPGMPIPESATRVHGITDTMVAGRHLDEGAIAALLDGVELVIAHNAAFDRPMLEKRIGAFSELNWACSLSDVDWRAEGYSGASLEYIALKLGFFYDAHRAETDCRALLEVLSRSGHAREPFLAPLVRAAGSTFIRLWALNAPFEHKDVLRSRGYRWSTDAPKAWSVLVPKDRARAEAQWLFAFIYGRRPVTVRYDVIDAKCRFTDRIASTREIGLDRLL